MLNFCWKNVEDNTKSDMMKHIKMQLSEKPYAIPYSLYELNQQQSLNKLSNKIQNQSNKF